MPEKTATERSERRLAAGVHEGVGERLPDRPVQRAKGVAALPPSFVTTRLLQHLSPLKGDRATVVGESPTLVSYEGSRDKAG